MVDKKQILEQVVAHSQRLLNCDMKVSVYDIRTKESYSVKGNRKGWAASIIKVPIMIATLDEIVKGNISPLDTLKVDHKYTLEPEDRISQLPQGSDVNVFSLLNYMIIDSDNEATNMLADKVGVTKINEYMHGLGMKGSMLGHLLCRGMPRYSDPAINPDGSNVTTTDDMALVMRQIYDSDFSSLDKRIRSAADGILLRTGSGFLSTEELDGNRIKSKIGAIFDSEAGADLHTVGIIDDYLIVAVMVNKVEPGKDSEEDFDDESKSRYDPYRILSGALKKHFL